VVYGTEGPGSLDELDELVVASLQPLQTVRAGKNGSEGEGRGGRVKVEDGAADDEIDVAGEEERKYVEVVGTKGGRRANIGGGDTRCSGWKTERGKRQSKQGRRGRDGRDGS
jgi:hypothetical protein